MNRTAFLSALGALCIIAFGASGAQAQATRTWISGVGDDANPCSRTAPCKSWAGAISKTVAGGEIDALDPGGFGAVNITKAITLAAEGAGEGGVLSPGSTEININAGPNDIIILRGLQIDGGPLSNGSSNFGVKVFQARVVEIQNCTIRNNNTSAPNGYGVMFTPNNPGGPPIPQLIITDTTITSNGNLSASSGGGILIQPVQGASINVTLTNDVIVDNVLGVRADASLTTGAITMTINNSTIASNAFAGVSAFTVGGSGTAQVEVTRTTIADNGGAAVNANGANAIIRLNQATISGNKTGIVTANTGVVSSAGNNLIIDNTNAGSAPTSTPTS
jgi:hypothetical protein